MKDVSTFLFRYKHIVARRLSIVGANVAYGIKSNPTNGPFPTDLTVQGRTSVIVHYKENITYNNQETSGFSVCCISYSECDEAWIVLEMTRGKMETSMTVTVNFEEVCGDNVPTGLAYLWEDTPTKRMFGLPIYSNDKFHLPGAPWKFELAQFMDN